jgi:hypothetical protein
LIWKMFSRASKEHASDGFLYLFVSIDTWCNRFIYLFSYLWIFAHNLKGFFFHVGELETASFFQLLDAGNIDIPLGKVLSLHIRHKHNARDANPVTWHAFRYILTISHQAVSAGNLSCWHILGVLLDLQALSINYY